MAGESRIGIAAVRGFWEANPLCAHEIPYAVGSLEYFAYYDRMREEIESPAFSAYVHEYDRYAKGLVLDVGCGNGYVAKKYAQAGARVWGIDITLTGIDLCRKRFQYSGLAGNFTVANAEKLPFGDDVFDCVCSMGVLHHTPDTVGAMSEIFRVLKPGGRVIVMFYHRNSAQYRVRYPLIRLLTGKTLQQSVNENDGRGNPKGDVYSRAELGNLLVRFTDIEMFVGFIRGDMVVPHIGRFVPQWALRPFERRWGWNLYAKAVKPIQGHDAREVSGTNFAHSKGHAF